MLFRPKFCCNCGEKIERLDWGVLTSRRFCEICETDLLIENWAPSALALIALMIGMFGTTALLRWNSPREKPVVEHPTVSTEGRGRVGSESLKENGGQRADSGAEKIYFFCGAMTRKGKACSRRVAKQGEHCWQHRSAESDPVSTPE